MSRIIWETLDKTYETGVDQAVLYSKTGLVIPWSGIIAVKEQEITNDFAGYYLNGIKRLNKIQNSDFKADVSAFMYPEEMDTEKVFSGFSYRTKISNLQYKIHLVYNPRFIINEKSYDSMLDVVSLTTFNWQITTTPIDIVGYAPSSHITIELSGVSEYIVDYVESLLYGTIDHLGRLPSIAELINIAEELRFHNVLLIIDNGDGSWTAIGPDNMITMTDNTSFEITAPSAIFIDSESYTLTSM